MATGQQFAFGEYTVDMAGGRLLRAGRRVHLRPQAYAALRYLIENRGRLVSKDELVREVWGGRAVTDDSLVQCLRDVRRALGDSSGYVRTERGRGYIFEPDDLGTGIDPTPPALAGARMASTRTSTPIERPRYGRAALATALVALTTVALVAGFRAVGHRARAPLSFVKLTSTGGVHLMPTMSPDRKWFAYSVANIPGADDEQIHLQAVGGMTSTCLTCGMPGKKTNPAFSPDGEQIAFAVRSGGVFIVGRNGGAAKRLTSRGFHPAWSPDGSRIAYSTAYTDWIPIEAPQTTGELWVVDVASGATTPLHVGDARDPAWSPDGSRIAYSSAARQGQNRNIFAVAVTGGGPVRVTDSEADDRSPTWAADGRSLYFVSNRAGAPGLWRVPIEQRSGAVLGPTEAVTVPSAFVAYPRAGAGGSLIYSDAHAESNIAVLSFDASTGSFGDSPQRVTSGTGFWLTPHAARDGQSLVLARAAIAAVEDIFIVGRNGTGLRQLTDDRASDRDPQLSPDGARVAFASNRGGNWGIWIVHADGSGVRPVTPTSQTTAWVRPHWSPDGTSIAAWEEPSRQSVIFDAQRTASGPTMVLPHPPDGPVKRVSHVGDHRAWSPDGKHLAMKSGVTLVIYSFESGTYRTAQISGGILGWIPNTSLLMLSRMPQRHFILVDTEGWATRELPFPSTIPEGDVRFSLSADGRALTMTHATFSGDVWLVNDPR